MSNSERGKIQFESGQSANDYAVMTDSGDHKIYTISGGTIFSGKSGFEAVVRPNGIVIGRNILSTNTTNDTISVAGFTAYSKGIAYEVSATTLTITRPTEEYQIYSVAMNDSGVVSIIEGLEHASALTTTRAVSGGPPEIPVDSVEIGQIKVTSSTPAVIDADEIFQTVGTHTERFDFPTWEVNTIGDGDSASVSAKKNSYVEFASELDAIHTGATYKQVYISYYTPIFAEASKALDFVPIENSHSVSSTQYYNGTIASVSSTLGQGKFTALLTDGVTDSLVTNKDEILTIKFYPDRNKTPYILSQGKIGLSRTYPVAGQNKASVTISSEIASADFSS